MTLMNTIKEIKEEEEMNNEPFPSIEEMELEISNKLVVSVYGDKGTGKSATAYGIMEPGDSCLVLSFDKKSVSPFFIPAIANMKLDKHIVDPTIYYTKRVDAQWLSSAIRTVAYIDHLLKYAEDNEIDWIFIDCMEMVKEIAEFSMRAKYKCGVFSGVQMAYWKERKRIVDNIHETATKLAKKGVIYSFYPVNVDVAKRAGEVTDSKTVPDWEGPWAASIKEGTDIQIHTYVSPYKNSWQFFANIESSKNPFFKQGEYDVTDICLRNALNVINK